MESYIKSLEIRWADLDPNFHVLHSRYYDFGAFSRMSFLTDLGIDAAKMAALGIGPIIFREECKFRREIKFKDEVTVSLQLQKHTADFTRWSLKHEIFKNKDTLAAIIHIDAAWMDLSLRKLAKPPAEFIPLLLTAPRASDYEVYNTDK